MHEQYSFNTNCNTCIKVILLVAMRLMRAEVNDEKEFPILTFVKYVGGLT